ncbi:MAG: LacI family DNA-binding transcriptional regulator [Spirochaetales bacterium]|nr:LacI family DNA-binding transcriptional regulator [Spirochaetales bacterium]
MNIKDVAKMAGVSISTISRVINNSAYVSPDIRERIEKVLADTGYRPNSLAKELLSHKTNTLGVMLPRIDLGTFSAIFDGISAVVTANGYNIILANTYDRKEEELRYLDLFHAKRVDGILYFATGIDDDHKRAISKLRMPVVIVGQSGIQLECPAVRVDNFGAARTMVNHLAALGHRRIGCIAVGDHDENIGKLRREGYRAALEDSGISYDPELVVTGDFEYPSGKKGAEKLMEDAEKRPTAIYCITDRLAIGAIAWLTTHGYKVPEDISVACVDDPEVLAYCNPPITTMSFDYTGTGNRAGKLMVDIINGKEAGPLEVVMPYTMRIRDSVRPLTAREQEE